MLLPKPDTEWIQTFVLNVSLLLVNFFFSFLFFIVCGAALMSGSIRLRLFNSLIKIFKHPSHLGVRTCQLSQSDELPADFCDVGFLHIQLYTAVKCTQVIKLHSKSVVTYVTIHFEAFATAFKGGAFLYSTGSRNPLLGIWGPLKLKGLIVLKMVWWW